MNSPTTSSEHGSRQRPILAGVATLGLLGALFGLALPAFASHPNGGTLTTGTSDNPTCAGMMGEGWEGIEIVEHPNGGDDLATSDSPASGGGVTISYTVDAHLLSFTVDTAGYLVEGVVVKGGTNSGWSFYDFGAGVTAANDLHTPEQQGISHVSFCLSEASDEQTSTPTEGTETNGETSTPTEGTETNGETSTPTEGTETNGETSEATGTGGELGGTSGGGRIPDTSAEVNLGHVVTVLSILLVLGSVAALAAPKFARRTNR